MRRGGEDALFAAFKGRFQSLNPSASLLPLRLPPHCQVSCGLPIIRVYLGPRWALVGVLF